MEAGGWQLVACCVLSGIVSSALTWVIAWNSDVTAKRMTRRMLKHLSEESSVSPNVILGGRNGRKYTQSR